MPTTHWDDLIVWLGCGHRDLVITKLRESEGNTTVSDEVIRKHIRKRLKYESKFFGLVFRKVRQSEIDERRAMLHEQFKTLKRIASAMGIDSF